jgi:hypothetical protein
MGLAVSSWEAQSKNSRFAHSAGCFLLKRQPEKDPKERGPVDTPKEFFKFSPKIAFQAPKTPKLLKQKEIELAR